MHANDATRICYFSATLGGNAGLLLGISYLTLCEFLDYGVRKIYHKLFPGNQDENNEDSIPD